VPGACRKSAYDYGCQFFAPIAVGCTFALVALCRKHLRYCLKYSVPGLMTSLIVNPLEMVDVNQGKSDSRLHTFESVNQISVESSPVENSQQRVAPSPSQLLGSLLDHTDNPFHAPDCVLNVHVFGNCDFIVEKNVIPVVLKPRLLRVFLFANGVIAPQWVQRDAKLKGRSSADLCSLLLESALVYLPQQSSWGSNSFKGSYPIFT
jgi:hypothetical protein